MRRLISGIILGVFFLAVLPVVGGEIAQRKHPVPVAAMVGGSSIHFKNSPWPNLTTYHVAAGSAAAARVAI
jgi:hypothetical protein